MIVVLPVVVKAAIPTGDTMAVFFAPWIDRDTALIRVVAADGTLVRGGGFPWIVVAKSADPAFALRLYREGAWLVGNPLTESGCATDVNGRL